jgi:hypothetical protein
MGMQHWDYTYRGIRDAASAAFRAGRNDEGSSLNSLAKQLRDELDLQVPAYKTTREGAAGFFGAQDALEAGKNFVTARGENADYRRGLAKMSDAERGLFAQGYASELAGKVHELRDAQNVLNQAFLTSPAARERTVMALGPDRANQLETYLRSEALLDRLRTALGNSTTARQLHEMAMAGVGAIGGEAIGHLHGGGLTEGSMIGMLMAAAAGYGAHRSTVVQRETASKIGEMLTSSDPAVLQRGVKMVANNKQWLTALRRAGDLIPAAGATAVTSQAVPHVTLTPVEHNPYAS